MLWEAAGSLSFGEGSSSLAHQCAFNYSHKPWTTPTARYLQRSFCVTASLTKIESYSNHVIRLGETATD